MKRFFCLLAFVSAMLVLTAGASAGPMTGAHAQQDFARWAKAEGGAHLDFEGLTAGTLLDNQYASTGVSFESIRDPEGTAISEPVVVAFHDDSNEITGSSPGDSESEPDERVAFEIRFASPQKWAGLVRDWDNHYTITRFYNSSGQLIHSFENHVPGAEAWSRIFFGYLVESDDTSQWIGRIECDGRPSDTTDRQVGYADDLYYGTAEVAVPAPFVVSSATVAFQSAKPDRFNMKGVLKDFSLTDAASLLFEAGIVAAEIPLESFNQNGGKLIYKAPRGKNGLLVLNIDLAEGTFSATGKNLVLTGFSNPLPVKLQAGSFKLCSMVHFRVAGNQWSFNSRKDPQYPCVLEEAPRADPNGFFVNRSASIRVHVPINTNPALNHRSLKLYRVDENLKTAGPAICRLYDDGKAGHGDSTAGDGVFSCKARFNESTAGELRLAAKAKVGGKTVVSPGVTVDAVVKLTEKQIDRTLSANKRAVRIWKNKRVQYGDTAEACAKALPGIRKVDGIKSARLSADGESIWVVFESGIKGALVLPLLPPHSVTGGPLSFKSLSSGVPSGVPEAEQQGHLGTGEQGAAQELLQGTAKKCPLGNCSAFIWAPFKWDFTAGDVGPRAHYYFTEKAAKYGMNFDPIAYCEDKNFKDNHCPVSTLDNLTDYGTIVFSTHGTVSADGNVILFLHEEVSRADILSSDIKKIQLSRSKGKIYIIDYSWWEQEGTDGPVIVHEDLYYGFGPDYIEKLPGRFKNSIIYAGACHSLDNETLANAFFGKGAGAYFGFKNAVPTTYERHMFGNDKYGLFDGLIEGKKNTGEAFAAIPEESDNDGYGKHFQGMLEGKYYDCYFLKASKTNNNLAYNCPALVKYKYAGASIKTHGDQLWIYSDNSTYEEKNVLLASGHYFPLEGGWTSGDTFTLDIKSYKDGDSTFTGKLGITLDLAPVSQEILGIKAFVFVLYEVWSGSPGYTETSAFSIGAYNLPPPVVNGDALEIRVTGSNIATSYKIEYDWYLHYDDAGQHTWLIPSKLSWDDTSSLFISLQKTDHAPDW